MRFFGALLAFVSALGLVAAAPIDKTKLDTRDPRVIIAYLQSRQRAGDFDPTKFIIHNSKQDRLRSEDIAEANPGYSSYSWFFNTVDFWDVYLTPEQVANDDYRRATVKAIGDAIGALVSKPLLIGFNDKPVRPKGYAYTALPTLISRMRNGKAYNKVYFLNDNPADINDRLGWGYMRSQDDRQFTMRKYTQPRTCKRDGSCAADDDAADDGNDVANDALTDLLLHTQAAPTRTITLDDGSTIDIVDVPDDEIASALAQDPADAADDPTEDAPPAPARTSDPNAPTPEDNTPDDPNAPDDDPSKPKIKPASRPAPPP